MKSLKKLFSILTLAIFLLSSCSTRGQYKFPDGRKPHFAAQSAEVIKGIAGLIIIGAFAIIFHDSHRHGHRSHHSHHGNCH
ncbi:MAG: hypothetical protein HRT88_20045 [Lentisphaeraceae bacterium]|nr:hypothetical protein [Lentisphaeraceae bacterium]